MKISFIYLVYPIVNVTMKISFIYLVYPIVNVTMKISFIYLEQVKLQWDILNI
jgi:hypothetical protein